MTPEDQAEKLFRKMQEEGASPEALTLFQDSFRSLLAGKHKQKAPLLLTDEQMNRPIEERPTAPDLRQQLSEPGQREITAEDLAELQKLPPTVKRKLIALLAS